MKKLVSALLAVLMLLSLAACGGGDNPQGGNQGGGDAKYTELPTIDQIKLGEDYQDITATVKILTNRTDIVDTKYKEYAESFKEMYPNITVEYEAVTDYEESLKLRLTTGDWGDICFISSSVAKSDLGNYFIPLGTVEALDPIYNFIADKAFNGTVYGIANGGNADGVAYNIAVAEKAGYSADKAKLEADSSLKPMPATPDEFLQMLQDMKDKTDAIPLYTNFADAWCVGAWDASPIFNDEGCIPARKDAEMPAFLASFDGIELLANNPAPEGHEDDFDAVNLESEVGINNDNYPDANIVEHAMLKDQTLTEIMDDWNAKWSKAQEAKGMEIEF